MLQLFYRDVYYDIPDLPNMSKIYNAGRLWVYKSQDR